MSGFELVPVYGDGLVDRRLPMPMRSRGHIVEILRPPREHVMMVQRWRRGLAEDRRLGN